MKIGMTYKIVGISTAILLLGTSAFSFRQRKRDKKTTDLLGIIQSKLTPSSNGLQAEKAFDINYLNKLLQQVSKKVLVIQRRVALQYAQQIHQGWGSWYQGGDDEAKVYAVFRKLEDKVQVSQIAKVYQETYSKNLIDVMKNRFSNSEIKMVLKIVEQLPNYRTL